MSNDIDKASKSSEPHVPNYAISTQEASGMICRQVRYYQEDIDKMKTMTESEILDYKSLLKKEGRYYY